MSALKRRGAIQVYNTDVPIGRITKIHEEVPSVLSRVISTLVVVTPVYITELGLLEPT